MLMKTQKNKRSVWSLLGCVEAGDEGWKAVKELDNSEGNPSKCWAEVKIRPCRESGVECACSVRFMWFGSLFKVIC